MSKLIFHLAKMIALFFVVIHTRDTRVYDATHFFFHYAFRLHSTDHIRLSDIIKVSRQQINLLENSVILHASESYAALQPIKGANHAKFQKKEASDT